MLNSITAKMFHTMIIFQFTNKRKDRSITKEPVDDQPRKFSARPHKDIKSNERTEGKIELGTLNKNSPFQKAYQNNIRSTSKRRRVRSKKHHTGSEILLKDPTISNSQDRNVSMEVVKNKSITELYKPPNVKAMHLKKKSLQYAMKRSRINDLLK